jgi:hypothetical protein
MKKAFQKRIVPLSSLIIIFTLVLSSFDFSSNVGYSQTKTDKVNLRVDNLSTTRTPTGITEIKGNVVNNSTSDVYDIAIDMAFYSKDGSLLGKFNRYATQPSFVLKPGESHSFNFFEIVSFYRIGETNVTAAADPTK